VRFDERSGKITNPRFELAGLAAPNLGTQVVVGLDGDIYTRSWFNTFSRFDHEGKPLNWPGQNTHQFKLPVPMSFMNRGLFVKSADEMYDVTRNIKAEPGATTGPGGWWTCLNVVGADGKSKRTVVWECTQGAIPKLDRQGNIYLADMVKPPDRWSPEFFDGKLDPPHRTTNSQDARYYYSYMYGSIIKFPPTGGAIWYGKKGLPASVEGKPPAELLALPKVPVGIHAGFSSVQTGELQGALWYRFGFAPYTCTMSSCMLTCMCEGGGFDVDPYGRVFFPNLGQFRIEVIDTNNNPITTFGKYGNQDSGGKDALVKKPDIPLAWPITVAVSDSHAYVADTVNRRVVRVKLEAAAEESAPLQ
jgi:hypothetical protein